MELLLGGAHEMQNAELSAQCKHLIQHLKPVYSNKAASPSYCCLMLSHGMLALQYVQDCHHNGSLPLCAVEDGSVAHQPDTQISEYYSMLEALGRQATVLVFTAGAVVVSNKLS